MSQPQYQIHLQNYNLDKTKLTKNMCPKIYDDVTSANSAAYDLLHNPRSEGEVVRVLKVKEDGTKVHVMVNIKDQDDVFLWAEVVKMGEGAWMGGEAEK